MEEGGKEVQGAWEGRGGPHGKEVGWRGKAMGVVWEAHGGAMGRTWGLEGPAPCPSSLDEVAIMWNPAGCPVSQQLFPPSLRPQALKVALPEAPPDVSRELQPDFGHSRQCLWGERHPPAGLPPPPAPRQQMGSSRVFSEVSGPLLPRPCHWEVAQSGWQKKGPTGPNRQVRIEGPLQRWFKERSPRVGGLGPAPRGERWPQAWRAGGSSWYALQGEWEETGKWGPGSAGCRQGCRGRAASFFLARVASVLFSGPAAPEAPGRAPPPRSGPQDLLPSLESLSWPCAGRDTLPSLAGGLVSAGHRGNVGQRLQVWPGARVSGRKNTQRGLPGRGLTSLPAVPTP